MKIDFHNVNNNAMAVVDAMDGITMDGTAPRGTARRASGTQSIERAAATLRAVAAYGAVGVTAPEVARDLGLNATTAYRLLMALTGERLLEREPRERRFRIGPGIHALSAGTSGGFSFSAHFDAALTAIAAATGDTAMLSVRRGSQSLCLARREGAFPIRTMTLQAGSRRPLGIGAGSLALLAFLPEDEREAALAANAGHYPEFGLDEASVRAMVAEALRLGHALNDGRVLEGMTAVGVPVRDAAGRVVAAVSVAAISARLRPERRQQVLAIVASALEPVPTVPDRRG